MASIINATTSTGLVSSADNSGSLQLATNNGTTAVTIDTSQNVGIGTTSPSRKLQVESSAAENAVFIKNTNATTGTNYGLLVAGGSNSSDYSAVFKDKAETDLMKITGNGLLQFNSGYGSVATAYGCRAWVNFNGTGTVAIRASGNVSSITDNGTGDYTVNFTTAMPDINYAISGATNEGTPFDNSSPARVLQIRRTAPTTTTSRFAVTNFSNQNTDVEYVYVQIFR